jgi:hypothetical protein
MKLPTTVRTFEKRRFILAVLYVEIFVGLRLAHWHTKEICAFATCGLTTTKCGLAVCGLIIKKRICYLRPGHTRTLKKFADLRWRNEPKNLRICDFRTLKIFCMPTIAKSKVKTELMRIIKKFNFKRGVQLKRE